MPSPNMPVTDPSPATDAGAALTGAAAGESLSGRAPSGRATTFHADRPVRTVGEDRLQIDPFVRRLVGPLLHAPADGSLVVGLYGPWGYGKTSALNLLENALTETTSLEGEAARRTPYAQVARFTPWLYSGVEALLTAFFDTLAAAIGGLTVAPYEQRTRLRRSLKAMGELIAPAVKLGAYAAAGPAGGAVASLMGDALQGVVKGAAETVGDATVAGEAAFRRRRDEAAAVLRSLAEERGRPIRVVVLIDELDRTAHRDEVLAVLKLVKLAADLPNVSYVLAMDRERVEEILQHGAPARFGAEYLDKIVQVGVTLPPISPRHLVRLLVDEARAVAEQAGLDAAPLAVDWASSDWRIADGVEHRLRPALRSLRDVSRVLNAYRFAALTGDAAPPVHAADLLALATLQTTFPRAYDAVRHSRRFLLHEDRAWALDFGRDRATADRAKAAREQQLDALARGVAATPEPPQAWDSDESNGAASPGLADASPAIAANAHAARGLVDWLFPHAVTEREHRGRDTGLEEQRERHELRIRSPERFEGYFRLSAPASEASPQLVAAVFQALVTGDGTSPVAGTQPLSAGRAPAWVTQLDERLGALPDDTRGSLLGALSDRASAMATAAAAALARTLPVLGRHSTAWPVATITGLADHASRVLAAIHYVRGVPTPRADEHTRALGIELVAGLVAALPVATAVDYARQVTDRDEHHPALRDAEDLRRIAAAGLARGLEGLAAMPDLFSAEQGLGSYEGASFLWDCRRLAGRAGQVRGEPYPPVREYVERLVESRPARVSDVLALAAGWSDGPSLEGRSLEEQRSTLARIVDVDWLERRVRAAAHPERAHPAGAMSDAGHWPHLIRQYADALDVVEEESRAEEVAATAGPPSAEPTPEPPAGAIEPA